MDGPLGSAEGGEARELERLRRRAYGRDGNIAGDVAAQARLSELEAAQHRQPTPVIDPTPSVPAPVPKRVPVAEPVEGARSTSTSVPQAVDGAPAAPWWRRRRWLMILGGATAALALITVAWLLQLPADEPTATPANTLTEMAPPVPDGQHRGEDEDLPTPGPDFVLALKSVGADADEPQDRLGTLDALGLSANELRQYENFNGLRVWSGESRYGMVCLLLADQAIREFNGAEGCSPRGLETVAEVVWFNAGGLTRFVLNGDHVEVYVFTRAADASRG
ncbi:hypothetical protein QFZ36_002056 [Pseudarthrobacter siccitolerans]|uniref:Uncharacterized protein n=1 Tax=Pseudarthrobacter siccitolerans TaxID=861266 RepID=A0ABU0PKM8_9MICC|nr:hypothetical protein [Pseudarthrobacter siccitolerans]MDQ0674495.1 hypothetical protein [Pseudarthrobacter siccitolerans]